MALLAEIEFGKIIVFKTAIVSNSVLQLPLIVCELIMGDIFHSMAYSRSAHCSSAQFAKLTDFAEVVLGAVLQFVAHVVAVLAVVLAVAAVATATAIGSTAAIAVVLELVLSVYVLSTPVSAAGPVLDW